MLHLGEHSAKNHIKSTYAFCSAVSSKQNKMSAESKRNPDLCQHIKNVLAMSTSLEYVHQGSDKPAAKLSMTPCFIAYTRPHCVYAVQEIIMSHVIKSGRKCW